MTAIKRIKINDEIKDTFYTDIIADGLCHNNIYRRKDITADYISGKVSTNIANGTFHDIFPGDRITFDRRTYVVGGLDCYMDKGDIPVSSHHILMFPFTNLGVARMNPTDITTGGFRSTDLYKALHSTESGSYYETISGDFGLEHLLEFRALLSDVTIIERSCDGVEKIVKTSGYAWSTEFLTLMSEVQAYGSIVTSSSEYDIGEATEQLPVFKLNPDLIHHSLVWWLRGVSSERGFCKAGKSGYAGTGYASHMTGVRPFFLIR